MQTARRPPVRLRSYVLVFALIAVFLILAHGPLLSLPYFWDEAGQFVPAALDIQRLGAWIPVSTLPNVHPPALMAYLAGVWSVFGYSITGTRIAMLLIAALGALATFLLAIELGRGSPGAPAFAALALLCASPLFFAQSMLAQLDMPAMCLSTIALLLFLQNRFAASAIACAVLVLVKETGVVAPAVFGCWLLSERRWKEALWFALPLPALLIWLFALHHATGYWFGNPAFEAYNLREPLNPARFLLALARRVYYLLISTGHFIGTAVLIYALRRMPLLKDRAWRVAGSFAIAHVVVVSLLGGAVLERYLLPALPVIYTAFAISLRALLLSTRKLALATLLVCLIAANFINPPYPFPFENNLAFANFIQLEQDVAGAVELRPHALIATAFPLTDALRKPDLGYVNTPHQVLEVTSFSTRDVDKLRTNAPDVVIVFDTVWDPLHLLQNGAIRSFLTKYYGYRPPMAAKDIATALGMRTSRRWELRGLSMQLLAREPALSR